MPAICAGHTDLAGSGASTSAVLQGRTADATSATAMTLPLAAACRVPSMDWDGRLSGHIVLGNSGWRCPRGSHRQPDNPGPRRDNIDPVPPGDGWREGRGDHIETVPALCYRATAFTHLLAGPSGPDTRSDTGIATARFVTGSTRHPATGYLQQNVMLIPLCWLGDKLLNDFPVRHLGLDPRYAQPDLTGGWQCRFPPGTARRRGSLRSGRRLRASYRIISTRRCRTRLVLDQ